jgi:hypothetical protein
VEHIGIDVHKRESQIKLVMEEGEVIVQRIRSERGGGGRCLAGALR